MATRVLLESALQTPFSHAAVVVAIGCFFHLLYNKRKRISVSHIPGPKKSHLFLGNLTDIYFKEAGEPHLQWQEEYGEIFKVYGLFGVRSPYLRPILVNVYDLVSQEEYLMVSDPKAIRHVYGNPHSFDYQKDRQNLFKMLFGPALSVLDVDDHNRQRRVMQSAFGSPHLRNLFPVFIRHTQKVCPYQRRHTVTILIVSKLVQLLKREISGDSDRQSLQINVYDYITRATLDITGDGELAPLFPVPICLIVNSQLRIPIWRSR